MKGAYWLAVIAVGGLVLLAVASGAEVTKGTTIAAATTAAPAAGATTAEPQAQIQRDEHGGPIIGALGPPPTKEELINAVSEYVKQDSYLKGGHFLIFDPATKQPLALDLVSVDTNMYQPELRRYVVTGTFKTLDGKPCDIDFHAFQLGRHVRELSNLTMVDIEIHSLDGKSRYEWVKHGNYYVEEAVK